MASNFYRRIKVRLLIIYGIGALSLITSVLVLNNHMEKVIRKNSDIGALINISGRQRMLSQNITKTALLLQSGRNVGQNAFKLDSLLGIFQTAHSHLISSIQLISTSDQSKEKLDTLFLRAQEPFKAIVSAASGISKSQENAVSIETLLRSERRFLPIMDQIVGQYEYISLELREEIALTKSLIDYIVVSAIIAVFGFVIFTSITTIRKYAHDLVETQEQLKYAADLARSKVQKLEFLTSAIKIGIWEKSAEEKTEGWSPQLYEILEYENNEIDGTLDQFLELTHPSDRKLISDASLFSIQTGEAATVEVRIKTKPGTYKWVEATGKVRKNEHGKIVLMMGGITDINSRKVLENQLKTFVENAPAAIAMFDRNINYLAASQEWIKSYNLPVISLVGRSHYEIFPEIGDKWKTIHQNCLRGAVESHEEDPFERADGSMQWLEWEVRPWYANEDEIGGILIYTEDITERKRKNDELRIAKEQAIKASKAKEEFLATMTHEIRTPLNAIIGLTHILHTENPREDQRENLNLLRFSADNLLTLINDILDMSKIESSKLELEEKPFDLFYLVNNIRRTLNFRAKENMVTITTNYSADMPRVFIGDVTRVTQILYNLTGNAIKFTRDGKVTISVNAHSIEGDICQFRISVKDEGIGISQENRERIFNSFEQAEKGTTRQYGGTGLGLFITKKLLQMMGSDIHLISEMGKGSEFFFDLTMKTGVLNPEHTRFKVEKPDFTDRNIKILIAEDNVTNRLIVEKFLANTGAQFEFAFNGEEVLRLLQQRDFDFILMDLQMPIMDGYTATVKIRATADLYFKEIPIIALTSDAFLDIRERTLSIGMDGYLSKPFRPADLYQVINRYAGLVPKPSLDADKV